jgi:geranylgeranyl diphosphate synthase, type II
LAFQLTDDILDAHEISTDSHDHKGIANYLSIAGPARTSERVQALLAESLKEMEYYGSAAEPLRAIARYVAERNG